MYSFSGIKKDLQDYWNTQGSIYDFGYESEEECQYWQQILNELIGKKSQKILDVGTGTGLLARNLAFLGHDVTGLDFSMDMTDQARKKMERYDLSWNIVMGDAEHPDFLDNSFDVVICRYLLWTLPHPDIAVSEWIRVLKPGGKIIIIDGKRKRIGIKEPISSKINKFLWAFSRWICRGYTGIQGHNIELEKNLPYFEGISAEEILGYFSSHGIMNCKTRDLTEVHNIIRRNLPWYLKFGYKSSGIVQVVSGEKSLDDN